MIIWLRTCEKLVKPCLRSMQHAFLCRGTLRNKGGSVPQSALLCQSHKGFFPSFRSVSLFAVMDLLINAWLGPRIISSIRNHSSLHGPWSDWLCKSAFSITLKRRWLISPVDFLSSLPDLRQTYFSRFKGLKRSVEIAAITSVSTSVVSAVKLFFLIITLLSSGISHITTTIVHL